jgi:hypothetical protein
MFKSCNYAIIHKHISKYANNLIIQLYNYANNLIMQMCKYAKYANNPIMQLIQLGIFVIMQKYAKFK